jgi:hypothetical protein
MLARVFGEQVRTISEHFWIDGAKCGEGRATILLWSRPDRAASCCSGASAEAAPFPSIDPYFASQGERNRTRLAMNEKERHEIEALLPWHAAGTLSRRDADRVEQALACDCELARTMTSSVKSLRRRSTLMRRSAHPPRAPWRSCSPQSMPRWQVRRANGVQVLAALLPAIALVILRPKPRQ